VKFNGETPCLWRAVNRKEQQLESSVALVVIEIATGWRNRRLVVRAALARVHAEMMSNDAVPTASFTEIKLAIGMGNPEISGYTRQTARGCNA